jgi:Flp pilus assembly protein TadB
VTVLVVAVACGLGAAGLLLVVRGLVGTVPPLTTVVADLQRPRTPDTAARRSVSFERLAGPPSPARDVDLAVCGKDAAGWVRDRAAWALIGATPGVMLVLLTGTAVVTVVPVTVAALVAVIGAAAGWAWARVDLASDAARARREFRHALASYLQLVTILMAGGAGVETAMFDAVAVGRGRAFQQLQSALTAAQARREPPWRQLGALGQRLGIRDLDELEAAMTLAGGGAQVRDSLTAKAAAIAAKDLAETESAAQARSETMVLPVALMFAGFLLLLGYPALSALSTP